MAFKVVCDRCGIEVFENPAKRINRRYDLGRYHLCQACIGAFHEWLRNGNSN